MRAAALTGAGISVQSGLPTFDFTWRGIPARDLLTLASFLNDPERFYSFFREALETWRLARPNEAHAAIAEAGITVVTQNIDGLHQKAGSAEVLEIHGSLRRSICLACGFSEPLALPSGGLPRCACGAVLKPDVVLFDEQPREWDRALALLGEVDYLLVVGTSLTVAPACYLPGYAESRGAVVEVINEDAAERVPAALERLRREGVL